MDYIVHFLLPLSSLKQLTQFQNSKIFFNATDTSLAKLLNKELSVVNPRGNIKSIVVIQSIKKILFLSSAPFSNHLSNKITAPILSTNLKSIE